MDYLKLKGFQVKAKIAAGNVVNDIIKESNTEKVFLIVTGRHKRQVIDELFISSTTDSIIKL